MKFIVSLLKVKVLRLCNLFSSRNVFDEARRCQNVSSKAIVEFNQYIFAHRCRIFDINSTVNKAFPLLCRTLTSYCLIDATSLSRVFEDDSNIAQFEREDVEILDLSQVIGFEEFA